MTVHGAKRKLLRFFIYFLPILILMIFIAWGYRSPAQTMPVLRYTPNYFHNGWSQQLGDETIPLEDIHDFLPVGAGESLVFTCTLPKITDDRVLVFYSVNKEVLCYIDGVLVQEFLMQDDLAVLKTPGSVWNQVDLDTSMSGKECTLIFHSPLGQYDSLCNLYFINEDYFDMVRIEELWVGALSAVLMSVAICILMGAIYATSVPQQRRYYIAITQYFLVVLLWMLARMNFFDIFTERPIISYLCIEVFRRLIPLSLVYVAKYSTSRLWHPKIIKGLTYVAWANLLMILVVPLGVGISILELEQIHYAVSVLIVTTLFLIVLEKSVHLKLLKYEEYPFLAIPLLLFGGYADIYGMHTFAQGHPFWGIWSALGCILFAMATFTMRAYINGRIASEKAQLEAQCVELENATLVKQLEAHFIFNALNTVSAYCKTNPPKADEAVKALASYLRTYLHLVGSTQNIPFKTELEMVRNYLVLQQMRFGDELQYVFDAEFVAFELPPFVVHTFVENAIIHGFRQAGVLGTITISAKRIGDSIQIVVADDGGGFDTNQPQKSTSVGVQNATRRLEIMRRGTIAVASTIGTGTTVTLTLPVGET